MWSLEFTETAEKQLRKLDKPVRQRILKGLARLESLSDPKDVCKALTGNWSGYWRYRSGDYRILLRFEENRFLILAVKVEHRSAVYQSW